MGLDYVAYWLCCAAVRSHTSLTKVCAAQGIVGIWLNIFAVNIPADMPRFDTQGKRGVCNENSYNVCETQRCWYAFSRAPVCVYIYVCKCASASFWVDGWMEEVKRGVEGGETPPGLTVLRVLHLANAAVRCGPLVVVLRQSQRPDPRPRRWLGAGGLRLLQAAVVIAVLGCVLQILRLIGRREGHSTVGQLWFDDIGKATGLVSFLKHLRWITSS